MPETDKRLEAVFREHHKFVFQVISSLGTPSAAVDDLVQDVFLVVARKLPDYEERGSMRSWLAQIARWVLADYRKKTGRSLSRDRGVAPPPPLDDPEHGASRRQAAAIVQRFLDDLPTPQRDAATGAADGAKLWLVVGLVTVGITVGAWVSLRPEPVDTHASVDARRPLRDQPPAAAAATPTPETTRTEAAPQADQEPSDAVAIEATEPALPPQTPDPTPAPRTRTKAPHTTQRQGPSGTLEQEIALIAEVRSLLETGRGKDALTKTKEHARRFPNGKLVDERKLLRMQALCMSGQTKAARTERDSFLAKKPDAAISTRVRETCR